MRPAMCRICLNWFDECYLVHFTDKKFDQTIENKLYDLMPEMDIQNPYSKFICRRCLNNMLVAFKFRELCFLTEETIVSCLDEIEERKLPNITLEEIVALPHDEGVVDALFNDVSHYESAKLMRAHFGHLNPSIPSISSDHRQNHKSSEKFNFVPPIGVKKKPGEENDWTLDWRQKHVVVFPLTSKDENDYSHPGLGQIETNPPILDMRENKTSSEETALKIDCHSTSKSHSASSALGSPAQLYNNLECMDLIQFSSEKSSDMEVDILTTDENQPPENVSPLSNYSPHVSSPVVSSHENDNSRPNLVGARIPPEPVLQVRTDLLNPWEPQLEMSEVFEDQLVRRIALLDSAEEKMVAEPSEHSEEENPIASFHCGEYFRLHLIEQETDFFRCRTCNLVLEAVVVMCNCVDCEGGAWTEGRNKKCFKKPFVCTICGEGFQRDRDLRLHLFKH